MDYISTSKTKFGFESRVNNFYYKNFYKLETNSMKIGYKATRNYVCKNQKYEIGQTYELPEKPIMCSRGFHYCKDAKNVLGYYDFNHRFRLLEIQDLSENTVCDYEKSATDKIKILREIVNPEEMFNLLGCSIERFENSIKFVTSNKTWSIHHYVNLNSEKLQLKSMETSEGYWSKYSYDSQMRLIKYENSDSTIICYNYDKFGNLISTK